MKRIYEQWAGNPKGEPEDKTRCIKRSFPKGTYPRYQCRRPRGYGKNKLFCKQHSKSTDLQGY